MCWAYLKTDHPARPNAARDIRPATAPASFTTPQISENIATPSRQTVFARPQDVGYAGQTHHHPSPLFHRRKSRDHHRHDAQRPPPTLDRLLGQNPRLRVVCDHCMHRAPIALVPLALLQEPIVAAMTSISKSKNKNGQFLIYIYDLGGGTFDVAIVQHTYALSSGRSALS
jgi:hypothetical protein